MRGCGFFQAGPEFVMIRSRSRDEATTDKDSVRTKHYDDPLRVIDNMDACSTEADSSLTTRRPCAGWTRSTPARSAGDRVRVPVAEADAANSRTAANFWPVPRRPTSKGHPSP